VHSQNQDCQPGFYETLHALLQRQERTSHKAGWPTLPDGPYLGSCSHQVDSGSRDSKGAVERPFDGVAAGTTSHSTDFEAQHSMRTAFGALSRVVACIKAKLCYCFAGHLHFLRSIDNLQNSKRKSECEVQRSLFASKWSCWEVVNVPPQDW